MNRPASLHASALALVLSVALVTTGLAGPLPTAAPASQGFSPERLSRLHARLQEFVEQGKHAGIIMLIARNGKVVDERAWGHRDLERKLPMETDTIVRVYSMSKIVTSVAALMLHEEGRLKLDDPIAKYLPGFEKPRVFKGGTAKSPVLVPAKTPITVQHLLTHTAGFIYGFGKAPLDTIYNRASVLQAPTMDDFVARAAKLPLAHEPGERFSYGINTDLVGAIVEKVSGQPFDVFLRTRIFEPLEMRDTGFTVPSGKRARFAKLYSPDKNQVLAEPAQEGTPYPDPDGRLFPSGGGGLFSTIGDFARFGQMLLNRGELDGVRILGRKAVELMEVNHLAHLARPTTEFSHSDGFGLGGAVRVNLSRPAQLGSVGQFGWSGAATTYVNIDPKERTVALVFTQHFPHNQHDLFFQFSTLMYAALVD
jgi:CubicO group peptidase (beta-lactamase class C family)